VIFLEQTITTNSTSELS